MQQSSVTTIATKTTTTTASNNHLQQQQNHHQPRSSAKLPAQALLDGGSCCFLFHSRSFRSLAARADTQHMTDSEDPPSEEQLQESSASPRLWPTMLVSDAGCPRRSCRAQRCSHRSQANVSPRKRKVIAGSDLCGMDRSNCRLV